MVGDCSKVGNTGYIPVVHSKACPGGATEAAAPRGRGNSSSSAESSYRAVLRGSNPATTPSWHEKSGYQNPLVT